MRNLKKLSEKLSHLMLPDVEFKTSEDADPMEEAMLEFEAVFKVEFEADFKVESELVFKVESEFVFKVES